MRLFDDVASRISEPFLQRAAELAWRGRGQTAPNPVVGCVVVRDGEVVGEGHHPAAGQPHAEVFALRAAAERARGADVYVTLEPCAHHGRTPPCADALIAAGVRRVVVGMADPTAEAGGGAQRLRDAGLVVEWATDAEPFRDLNEGWLTRLATGRPLVVAKVALSLDGSAARRRGERASVTGTAGSEVTRLLRGRCDAVMVGAATVIADDPSLTLRGRDGAPTEHQPMRTILCRSHVPPADSRVFTDGAAPTLVLQGSTQDERAGNARTGSVQHQSFDAARGVTGAIEALAMRGINEVLVEPGPRLLGALWEASAIDYLVTVVAGGMAGPDAQRLCVVSPDWSATVLEHRMSAVEAGIVGDVAVTVWRPCARDAES